MYNSIANSSKIVFIVEDNEVYAKLLGTFLQLRFDNIKEIKKFKIGETCLMELDLEPNIIIIDHLLNSKYKEAGDGLEIIKRIKAIKPQTHIIILSSQSKLSIGFETITQYNCLYVQKDFAAFGKIEQLVREIFTGKVPGILEQ